MNLPLAFRRQFKPVYGALLIGSAMTLLALLVFQEAPFFASTELAQYDFNFRHRTHLTVPGNIVVVGLDDTSITDLSGGDYPVARRWMARAISYLAKAHARAIGIDFLYEKSRADDHLLAQAMKKTNNLVQADRLAAASVTNYFGTQVQLVPPVDPLATAAPRTGLANVPTDPDSEVRRAVLQQQGPGGSRAGGKLYPSFAVQLASVALHKPVNQVVRGLPNDMLINYVGPQDTGGGQQSLFTVPFEGVARGEDAPSYFRNKIVILTCASVICNDVKSTSEGAMFGGYVQANALNTILRRDPILPADGRTNNLLILIVGLLTTLVASRFGIARSAIGTALVFIGYLLLVTLLFDTFRIWVHLVTPETAVVLVFGAVMAFRFATEERQRRRTGRIFGQYVKPEIVELLVNAHDQETALAGARRPITVLFVDVRGFTRMSESMEPEDVVRALDIYLEELTESVQRFDGTINKYVGDELIAVWNAPTFQHDHPALAVRCALDMVTKMEKINDQLRAMSMPAIGFGIGVNSGEAVVGQMGSSFRKQYDIIGDTMNTGARLCSAAGKGEIIIGELTWEMAGDCLVVEETEPLPLKGKSKPFRTFHVLGLKDETTPKLPAAVPASA